MKRIFLSLAFSLPCFADAVPTTVTVRVVARDAKAIYESVGGAWVTITDLRTHKVLAEGLHTGKSAGSTDKIMTEPRVRNRAIFDAPGTAVFTATIPLSEPTFVEIVAEGPEGFDQAAVEATKTLLLVPGKHITGDGIVLELHGLIVEASEPVVDGETMRFDARVRMACGCPIEPGGIWNADEFEVTGVLKDIMGKTFMTFPMKWSEGRWKAEVPRPTVVPHLFQVVAAHTASANFGMDAKVLPPR